MLTGLGKQAETPAVGRDASLPLVEELAPAQQAEDVFARMAGLPHCLFLDSALAHPTLGRYSFVAADPFDFVQFPADGSDALSGIGGAAGPLHRGQRAWAAALSGGAAGLLGYDLGRSLERVPPPVADEFRVPAMAVGLYDVVVAFDHLAGRAWLISQGFPEIEPSRRRRRAAERLAQLRDWLTRRSWGRHSCLPRWRMTVADRNVCPTFRPNTPSPARRA